MTENEQFILPAGFDYSGQQKKLFRESGYPNGIRMQFGEEEGGVHRQIPHIFKLFPEELFPQDLESQKRDTSLFTPSIINNLCRRLGVVIGYKEQEPIFYEANEQTGVNVEIIVNDKEDRKIANGLSLRITEGEEQKNILELRIDCSGKQWSICLKKLAFGTQNEPEGNCLAPSDHWVDELKDEREQLEWVKPSQLMLALERLHCEVRVEREIRQLAEVRQGVIQLAGKEELAQEEWIKLDNIIEEQSRQIILRQRQAKARENPRQMIKRWPTDRKELTRLRTIDQLLAEPLDQEANFLDTLSFFTQAVIKGNYQHDSFIFHGAINLLQNYLGDNFNFLINWIKGIKGCERMDKIQLLSSIKAFFNIRGAKLNKNYSKDLTRVEKAFDLIAE